MQSGEQASAGSTPASDIPDRGPLAALLRTVGSLTGHLEALFHLFRFEAGEAGRLWLILIAFFAMGLLFLGFGYIVLVLFFAFLCEALFGFSWLWITLALGLIHILLAVLCAWRIREGIRTPVFSAFTNQIRRDSDALKGKANSAL